jgi:hypothetical protein
MYVIHFTAIFVIHYVPKLWACNTEQLRATETYHQKFNILFVNYFSKRWLLPLTPGSLWLQGAGDC